MKKVFLGIIFFAIILTTPKVNAAGNVSLISNKSSVNVGEEFTISVSLSGAQVASLTSRVTIDTSKVQYVSGPSNSNFRNGRIIYTWTDPNGGETPLSGGTIATFTLKGVASGNAGFSASGDFYSPEETALDINFSGTTVAIIQEVTEEPMPSEPPVNNEPTQEQPPQQNNEQNQPEETPQQQNPDTQEPNTQAPETPSTLNVPDYPQEPETPDVPQKPQTPQNQQKPETPSVTNKGENVNLSSNTNLKSLRLDLATIVPEFKSDILQYKATVNETINNVDVLAVPEDENSSIGISGNNNLQLGDNVIEVTVTAENREKKTYNIIVTKTDAANLSNSYLENLAIENAFLVPEFSYNVFEYEAEVENSEENINILAVPQIEGSSVSIEGNNNLKYGENIVKVIVKSQDENWASTYTIKVYRKTVEEERMEEENEENNNSNTLNDVSNDMNEKYDEWTYSDIIMAIVISLGAIGIIVMLVWKYRKKGE